MFKPRVSIRAKFRLMLLALVMLSLPTSAQGDNCCGIDRQCSTNDDWVRGYYAFRNSQCAAGDLAATATNGEASDSNNCCFDGWQCDSDDDWTSGYWAFRRDQCEAQAQAEAPVQAQAQGVKRDRRPQPANEALSASSDPRRSGEPVSAWINRSKSEDEYELNDGTEIGVSRITWDQMCKIWPGLNRCQYPESYR